MNQSIYDQENSISHPENWRVTLYPHQLASIKRMEILEKYRSVEKSENCSVATKVGILADITGYGKTLTVLGLISRDRMQWDRNIYEMEEYQGTREVYLRKVEMRRPVKTSLIVVPNALLEHWESECSKTDLKPLVLESKKECEEFNLEEHHMVICPMSIYPTLMSVYSQTAWNRIIFDEPHTMMNLSCENFPCNFIWLVTATPLEIYKKVRRSMFSNIIPENMEIFSSIIIKNSDEFVKESFSMPLVHHHWHQSFNPTSYILKGHVSDSIQEMIDAGNIKGALYALGCSRKDEKVIYEIVQEKSQKKMALLRAQMELADNSVEKEKLDSKIQEQLTRLSEITERLRECLRSECCLCSQEMSEAMMLTCCQNIVCTGCQVRWTSSHNTCPFCRQTITFKNLIIIDRIGSKAVVPVSRSEIVTRLVEKSCEEEGRIIIYSNHDESFSGLKEIFTERGWEWNDMKGKREAREKSLSGFRSGESKILLLNSQVNSSGFNLPETTDIIFYHQVPEMLEVQVMGRALRIGRSKQLHVHHVQ